MPVAPMRHRNTWSAVFVGTVAALLAAGCNSSTDSRESRQLASIGETANRRIVAPDTVHAGIAFTATVYAWGSASTDCNVPDGTEVSFAGNVQRIQGFFRVPTGTITCVSMAQAYPISVSVTFPTPGTGILRSIGHSRVSDAASPLDSVQKTVVVVP